MQTEELIEKIGSLSPKSFENLVYDCLTAVGLRNLVWRTPGSDGGRDIEGLWIARDPTGHESIEKWYIECKRYSSSVDWPTIWSKVSHAVAKGADCLLLATNNNPSPLCEERITEWNAQRKQPRVRVWRGYDFPNLLRLNKAIAISHGLTASETIGLGMGSKFPLLMSKLASAGYANLIFGSNPEKALAAANALSELYALRMSDVEHWGKFVAGTGWIGRQIDRVNVSISDLGEVDEVALRAIYYFIRFGLSVEEISIERSGPRFKFSWSKGEAIVTSPTRDDFSELFFWCRAELVELDYLGGSLTLELRT